MKFTPTEVEGCFIVDMQLHSDDRGFFARSYCTDEFAAQGIDLAVAQANTSFNHHAGTMRGLHRQVAPAAEGKLVRCTAGAITDCCIDLREDSPTYGKSVMVNLNADNHRALWVPPYCGHGYLTRTDETEVTYLVSGKYSPDHERGQRWNDPAFGLEWPAEVLVISDKDADWPDWTGKPLR